MENTQYIPSVDRIFHDVYHALTANRWHDFREVGEDEPYYDFYYAEDQLYIIRDRLTQQYWFTRARSPKFALQKFKQMLGEVMKMGAYEDDTNIQP